MAVESPDKSYVKTPRGNCAVDNLSFSMDSLQLGDSTRSLLSPLYDREATKEKSFHSEDDELSEGELEDKSTRRSNSTSEDDHSEIATVRKREDKESSSRSSFSYASSNSTSSTPNKSQQLQNKEAFTETELNSWEKWLLSKVIKDHERVKNEKRKKRLEKEISKKEMAEKIEKEQKAELNRKEWLEFKSREERIRNELKRREERLKAGKEQEEKERIQRKSEESYKDWSEAKEHERKQRIKSKQREKWAQKEAENNRKQKSQKAYEQWLEKAKHHPKATRTHFGYLNGKVTGYYDWTCYPMPSYNNPNPWVAPKVKKKYLGKIELQNPSPPLLFKDLEQREQNKKQKNSKLKMKKVV